MKLQSIQALRGIAALLVAVFHGAAFERLLLQQNGSTEQPLVAGLFLNGYGGVDLFFVISGFIMVWVTHGQPHRPLASLDFLFARISRIYPLWWAAAGAMALYALFISPLMVDVTGGIDREGQALSTGYLVRSFLLIPQEDYPVLAIGWTLIHEIYFYAVFAILMLLPRGFLPFAMLVWGGIVTAASLAGLTTHIATGFLTLALHPMTMEFIFGVAVGLVVTSGITWRAGIITLIAALWLTAGFCLQGPPDEYGLQWGRVLMFGLPSALLIYGLAALDIHDRLAWLLPAAIGAFVMAALYQLYGLAPEDPFHDRAASLVLPSIAGIISILVVLWSGWLGGRAAPGALMRLRPVLNRMFAAVARTGDWSYSIYLGHLFVFGLLKISFERLQDIEALAPVFRVGHPGPLDNLAFITLGIAGSILAGWIGYRLVERPGLILAGRAREALFYRSRGRNRVSEAAPA